jgi:hypothetical protein
MSDEQKFKDREEFKPLTIKGKKFGGPGISVNGWVGCLLSDGKGTYIRFYRNANLMSFLHLKIEEDWIDAPLLHPDPTVVICDADVMLKRSIKSGKLYVDVSNKTLCISDCEHEWLEIEHEDPNWERKKCVKCGTVHTLVANNPMIG